MGIKNQDPIHRINRIERLRRIHADPYLQALLLARLIKFNATLKLINSIKVEVIDTLNNKTSKYPSLTEAAQKIGCSASSISKYLIDYNSTGKVRLFKERYFCYYLKDKSKFIYPTPEELDKLKKYRVYTSSTAHALEVIDTLNKDEITTYPSIKEAARFIGVSDNAILRALKELKPGEEVTRAIKKRFKVKRL